MSRHQGRSRKSASSSLVRVLNRPWVRDSYVRFTHRLALGAYQLVQTCSELGGAFAGPVLVVNTSLTASKVPPRTLINSRPITLTSTWFLRLVNPVGGGAPGGKSSCRRIAPYSEPQLFPSSRESRIPLPSFGSNFHGGSSSRFQYRS